MMVYKMDVTLKSIFCDFYYFSKKKKKKKMYLFSFAEKKVTPYGWFAFIVRVNICHQQDRHMCQPGIELANS